MFQPSILAKLILKAIFSRWQRRREQPGPPEPAQRPQPRPRTAPTARGQAGAAPEAGRRRRRPGRAERQPAEPPARAGPGGGRDGGREEQGAAAAVQQGAQEEQWAEPEPGIRTVLSGYNENLGFTQRLRFSIFMGYTTGVTTAPQPRQPNMRLAYLLQLMKQGCQ